MIKRQTIGDFFVQDSKRSLDKIRGLGHTCGDCRHATAELKCSLKRMKAVTKYNVCELHKESNVKTTEQ